MSRPLFALGLALTLVAPAAADPAAEGIRGKVRGAVGYDAFRKLEHGVVLTGRVQDQGESGRFVTRLHADGRYLDATDTRTGSALGFDGRSRWVRRFGANPALPAELSDGDHQRFSYALLGHRWLDPDAGYAAALDPREHRAYRPCLVVRHPDCPGVAGRVYLDPETWLPTRLSVFVGRAEEVTEVSDWRDVGGAKVPARVSVGRYGGGQEQTADSVAAAAPPAGGDPFAPPPPPDDTRFDPDTPAAVEAKLHRGMVMLRTAVNGRPGPWLVLNTACTGTALTPASADRFGLPAFGKGQVIGTDGVAVRFRSVDRLGLGPAIITGRVVDEVSLEGVADVDGVLGGDVLSRVVMEVDFGSGRVAVHDPRRYVPPAGVAWETARFDAGIPFCRAVFEGRHTGHFKFGTAAYDPLQLSFRAVRELGLLAGRLSERVARGAVGGNLQGDRGVAAEFRVFGRTARNVPTLFLADPAGVEPYPYTLGEFGPAALGPGTVVLDYPGRRIGFVPKP